MAWQQNQGSFDPSYGGVPPPPGMDDDMMDPGMDMPPPPPEDGERGAGWEGPDGAVPPPEPDVEDGFGVPPPPESLLTGLVFDEPDSPANIMRDPQTQNLKAGSFAKIIERLTHPTVHDSNFLFDFVLTYRSFATPFEVLEALIRRYETAHEEVKRAIGLRVFNVIKHWIEKAWHDFDKDAALPERCMDFLDRCISSNDPLKGVATGIRTNLVRKKSGDEATITKATTNPPPVLVGPRDNQYTPLMDLNAEEIARQLTQIEWDIWVKIQPWECLGLSWTKKNKETAAPNVLALINRFNVVSGWVATTICTLELPKKRTKAIGKFLEISGHLMAMGNVNGVMEVVSGLGRGAVFRMKQTWEGLTSQQKKTYEEVKKLTDRSLSYANLRGAVKKLNPPCIPYLGMYLTDLTFIEEGNKDFLNNLINWNKRHLISETIRQIRQYQLQAYVFTPIPWLQTNLQAVPVMNEDELYELSEWLEVRAGKERGPKPQILIKAQAAQEAASSAAAAALAAPSSSSSSSAGRNTPNASLKQVDSVSLESGHNWPFYESDSSSNVDIDTMTNNVRSGTLVKIVERLTHNSSNPDSTALFGFLAMYRSFSNANDILDLLIQRWNVPPPKDRSNPNYNDVMLKPIQLRVFNFIKTWIDRHFSDFESSEPLKAKLKNFISGSVAHGNEGYAKVLTATLTKQEAAANQPPNMNDAPAPFIPPAHLTSPTFYDLNSEEIARQLTLIHHRTFTAIRAEELLEQMYRSLDKEVKAKHVVSLQAHFHYLFTFSKNEVLNAEAQGNSAAAVTKLLEVVSRLVALHNFFGARAMVEGIDYVLKSKPTILDNISPESKSTFTEGKDTLMAKASTRVSLSPPMVLPLQPFFNEITASELAIGQPLPDKRINFEKRLVVAEIIVRLSTYQKLQYAFYEVPAIKDFFVSHKMVGPMIGSGAALPPGGYSGSVSGFNSSPNNSFVPRGSSAANGSFDGGAAAPTTQLTFFMMDLVLHDDEVRHEIQDLAAEVYRMNVALIQDEIKQLVDGKTAAPAKLNLSVPAPKAAMPAPPLTTPPATLGFSNALAPNASVSPTPATVVTPTPTQIPHTSPPAMHPPHPGSIPKIPPGVLPPAGVGMPKMQFQPPPGAFTPPHTNPALGGVSSPNLGGNTNPALGAPSNPALGGHNPALGAHNSIGTNPALVGGSAKLGIHNPTMPTSTPPPVGLPPNPALTGGHVPGLVGSPSNPALAGGHAPGLVGSPSNPALTGHNPGLVGSPSNPALTGHNPSNLALSGSGGLVRPTMPTANPPPSIGGSTNPALSGHNPGLVGVSSNPGLAAPSNPALLSSPAPQFAPPTTPPPTSMPSNLPAATGLVASASSPNVSVAAEPAEPVLRPVPLAMGGKMPANMKFPLPVGPGTRRGSTAPNMPPLSVPAAVLNSTSSPAHGTSSMPAAMPPSTPPNVGGFMRSTSTNLVPTGPPPSLPVPATPPSNPTPPPTVPTPDSIQSTSEISPSTSAASLNSSGGSFGSNSFGNSSFGNGSYGNTAPPQATPPSTPTAEAKPLPPAVLNTAATPKSRQSFTSASKQASIRDLMAGLGKVSTSPSSSSPLRSGNPLAGSGQLSSSPGTPSSFHTRVNSGGSSDSIPPPSPTPSPAPVVATPSPVVATPSPVVAAPAPVVASPASPSFADVESSLRIAATNQLAMDFPNAPLASWSAVEPGTNETLHTDLLKTDRASYVCSINAAIGVADINNLVRVGKLFKQQNPTLPLACIVLTFNIDAAASDLATRYKMKVYQLPKTAQ